MAVRMNLVDRAAVGLGTAARGGALWIALASVVARHRRTFSPLITTSAAAWCAEVVALVLAHLVGRVRPCPRRPALIECPRSASFPSSHSATAAAAAVTLSRHEPRLTLPLVAVAAAVAASRVRVGVHYVSDVLAGLALGVGVAGITSKHLHR